MSAWRRDIGHRFDGQKANTTRVVAYLPGNSKVSSVLSRSAGSEALSNDTIEEAAKDLLKKYREKGK